MVGISQSGPELPSSGADWPGWMFGVFLCNDLHACDRSPVSTVFLTWHKCLQLVQWPGYVCWPIVTNLRPITVTHAWARPAWLLNTKPQTFESPMLLLIWMSVRRFVPWTLGAWFISRSNELPTWHFPTDQLRFGRCANSMLSSRVLCARHGWHPKLLPGIEATEAGEWADSSNAKGPPFPCRCSGSGCWEWRWRLQVSVYGHRLVELTNNWSFQAWGDIRSKSTWLLGTSCPWPLQTRAFFGLGAQRYAWALRFSLEQVRDSGI